KRRNREHADYERAPHEIRFAPELSQVARGSPVELNLADSSITLRAQRSLFGYLARFTLALLPKHFERFFILRRQYARQHSRSLILFRYAAKKFFEIQGNLFHLHGGGA